MKWRRRFYRFLKKEGAYTAYMKNVKEYWKDYTPHNIYIRPSAYIDSTFIWSEISPFPGYWDILNKKWLSALRRDWRVKQFSGYKITQMPTLRFSSGAPNFSQIPKHEGIDFSGLFPSVEKISKIVDAANIRIVVGTGCGPSTVSSLFKLSEIALTEEMKASRISPLSLGFSGIEDMQDTMEDLKKAGDVVHLLGPKEESIDFNVKGNQPNWFSKKRRK